MRAQQQQHKAHNMQCKCKHTIVTSKLHSNCANCKSAYAQHIKQRNTRAPARTVAQQAASLRNSIKKLNATISFLKAMHAKLLQKSNYCSVAFAERCKLNAEIEVAQTKLAALQKREIAC